MRALIISAIVLVAVIMGLSAIVSSIQATAIPSQLLAEQIAEDNGIDLDQPIPPGAACRVKCGLAFEIAVTACEEGSRDIAVCILVAVDALRQCLADCRLGHS